MKQIFAIILLLTCLIAAEAQPLQFAVKGAERAMQLWPDSFLIGKDKVAKWRYDQGVILKGIDNLWYATGDKKWYDYMRKSMDFYVNKDGLIRGYQADEYNIDHLNNGKILLTLYRVTGNDNYRLALTNLRNQVKTHPRTDEGGLWHKKIYTQQMWLDGLYMAQPFLAEYAAVFNESALFDDITKQFVLSDKNMYDPGTGLWLHGWDASRQQAWANKETGRSPNVWGRSLGWYGMALVDALEYMPDTHPGKAKIVEILKRFNKGVLSARDPKTGLWYDLVLKPSLEGNYLESSASAMLIYTLAKSIQQGYLPVKNKKEVIRSFESLLKEFVEPNPDGGIDFTKSVAVSGLGGNPYRDGSDAYYLREEVISNDPKGLGAFILCAGQMQNLVSEITGRNRRVLLDNFFNNEWKNDKSGNNIPWHYTWEEKANGGYAVLGSIFNRFGAKTETLKKEPDAASLRRASIYIIVDPDTEKETANPNYFSKPVINQLRGFVREGGLLVLLGNDSGNAEFKHFNELASSFGISFNEDRKNLVINDQFEQGAVMIPAGNPIFKAGRKLFLKEVSSINTAPRNVVLQHRGFNVMAVAKYGRGRVFALGDPWIYNEYIDGRKLPAEYTNYAAAEDWVQWLLKTAKSKRLLR